MHDASKKSSGECLQPHTPCAMSYAIFPLAFVPCRLSIRPKDMITGASLPSWQMRVSTQKEVTPMTTVQPEGENIRKATKWIAEEKQYDPDKSISKLIEVACIKFDLSPMEAEFLARTLKG